jgi:integrase
VEQWLESLSLAPGSKTKIRNIMSAIYGHGIRNECITLNPISKVRCSAKRLREPDVINPEEFQALLRELQLRERARVMLAGSTGLRRSELFALRWCDVNLLTIEIAVTRSCVHNRFGPVNTWTASNPAASTILALSASWQPGTTRALRRCKAERSVDALLFINCSS